MPVPIPYIDTISKPLARSMRVGRSAAALETPNRVDLLSLFAKYDVAAPRYTSYPPATQFSSKFDSARYIDLITQVGQTERSELSLYVHLPFCDTLCYFCGCTMLISNNREKIAEYLHYLKREISLAARLFERRPTVVQIHWGGGSPTHLTPTEIRDLGSHIRRTFDVAVDAEISIEIDPRGVTREHVRAMRDVGFNRASVGVQDFDPGVQVAINRMQPREITESVIGWCRSAGISQINLDLIYGLPYQTRESFRDTIEAVAEISPDRIAVYNFAYVPWIKPHQKLIPIEILPKATSKLALLELAIQELSDAGYEYLGMDHFAKPNDSLVQAQRSQTLHRNFQGYSTQGDTNLLAFGISAIGRVENSFAQNVKELQPYYERLAEWKLPIEKGYELTRDDSAREYAIMQLMCNLNVDKEEFGRLFGTDFDTYFEGELQELEPLADDGLIDIQYASVEVTDRGRYFLRNIASTFDAYLPSASVKNIYSKAV